MPRRDFFASHGYAVVGAGRARQVRIGRTVSRLRRRHDRLVRRLRLDRLAAVVHGQDRHLRLLVSRRRPDHRRAAAPSADTSRRLRRRPAATSVVSAAGVSSGDRSRAAPRRCRSTSAGCRSTRRSTRARGRCRSGPRPASSRRLPLIDMTDRAGSPSWDWRNFLERSPDDPWWDARGYLTGSARRIGCRAARVVLVRPGREALEEAEIFRKNAHERSRAQRAVRDHLAHHALRVRSAPAARRWSATCRWATRAFTTARPTSPGSIGGCAATSTRSTRCRASSTTSSAGTSGTTSEQWPVKGMNETTFFLAQHRSRQFSRGRWTADARRTQPAPSAPTHSRYDPANPVPARGGSICCTGNPKDVSRARSTTPTSSSVPTCSSTPSEVLREGLELTGPITAVIALSSDAPDTDVTVKLLDVFPDGRAMNMQEGITRVAVSRRLRSGRTDEARQGLRRAGRSACHVVVSSGRSPSASGGVEFELSRASIAT